MMQRWLGASVVAVVLCACASIGPQHVKLDFQGKSIALRESGAIIVEGRQVAKLMDNGKIVAGDVTVAWLHEDGVRLKGGILIPIRADNTGTIHLSKTAQSDANLVEVEVHITKDGKYSKNSTGTRLDIGGNPNDRQRRLLLAVLLVDANKLWP